MISIVIATYNGALFIKDQLKSIENQTLLPDEIIISDDFSTDNTLDIINRKSSQTTRWHALAIKKTKSFRTFV